MQNGVPFSAPEAPPDKMPVLARNIPKQPPGGRPGFSRRLFALHLRRPWVIAVATGLFLCVFAQGFRGLYESTEGRYAECAREMMANGNWLQPVLNGEPHLTKPPMTYWAISGGLAMFGNTVWGARFYLIAAFVLTVAAVYVLERALWQGKTQHFGAMIFAAAPFAVAAANVVSTDALLTLWWTWAFAFYWLAVRSGRRRHVVAMWLFLGLAVSTKGPVGLFPLLAILPAHAAMRRRGMARPRLINAWGAVLFIAVGLSWYAYVILSDPEMFRTWVSEEILGRTLYTAHARISSQPHKILVNYVPILLVGAGPWLLILLYKFRRSVRWSTVRKLVKDRAAGPQYVFLFSAIGAPFVVFSLTTSRLPLYLAPIMPPLALAAGKGIETLCERRAFRPVTFMRILLALVAVVAVAKAATGFRGTWKDTTTLARELSAAGLDGEEANLVVFFREPLNGLSFHLGRTLPTLYVSPKAELNASPDTAKGGLPLMASIANGVAPAPSAAENPRQYHVPAGTRFLMRRKDARLVTFMLGGIRHEPLLETGSWAVLELQQPLDFPCEKARSVIGED